MGRRIVQRRLVLANRSTVLHICFEPLKNSPIDVDIAINHHRYSSEEKKIDHPLDRSKYTSFMIIDQLTISEKRVDDQAKVQRFITKLKKKSNHQLV